jgi:pyridoxine/pyridoxamine 5'-phosphate oxidase
MSGETTAAAARALIDRSQYLTLATADADGRPWASPVWFAHEEYAEFLWGSRPDARHSQNIDARPAVALVLFDSTVAPGDAQAVYVEAEAKQVGAAALDDALSVYSERSVGSGLSAWSAAEVTGAAPYRLYRARPIASFILAANDRRVPVSLSKTKR